MNYSDFASVPFLQPLGLFLIPLIFVVLIWTLVIKGFGLWKAARNGDRVWFIVLLIVNTCGILELIYLFWITKSKSPAVAEAPSNV